MTGRYVSSPRKLLILALDGASPERLRAWAADGTMPNCAAHMADGLVGDTWSVAGLEGATWPTFYTGVTAGGHGFFWMEQLERGTYRTRWCTAEHLGRRKALWEVLSEAGKRVLVLDVPICRSSPYINGAQVVEWGTHDPNFGFQTTPARIGRAILKTVGPYPAPLVCDVEQRSLSDYRAFADQLIEAAAGRARLTRQLLREERWDFAIQVFTETHCAGHQLWHFHDSAHPAFDAGTTRTTGNLLREVYAAVDIAIGDILTGVGPDTTVVLLTLHGMTFMAGGSIIMPEVLTRLGAMNANPAAVDAGEPRVAPASGSPLTRGLRAAYHMVPEGIRLPVYELRQKLKRRWLGWGEVLPFDPVRTKCFPIDVGRGYSGIRLNLLGREPQGTITPGAGAERFCEELTRDLLEITEPDTNRRLIQRVIRTADLYRGAYADDLPDLIAEWDTGHALGSTVVGGGAGSTVRAQSPRIGSLEAVNTYCRTGDHLLNGMFVARGPGLAPGRLDHAVSNLDLAPTFAGWLGCEMPDVEGKPIPELLAS